MTRPAPDLSGIYLKLDRAEKHVKNFHDEVLAFLERDPEPFGFRAEKTPGVDQSVAYNLFAIVREEPPRELGLIVGDAIQNLRSALDHLVYELAPPRVQRKRRGQFPIFDDECEFKVKSPPMLQGLADDERTLIERLQPYAATKVPSDDPLAILRKLSNRDKHHLLVAMVATVSETNSWVAPATLTSVSHTSRRVEWKTAQRSCRLPQHPKTAPCAWTCSPSRACRYRSTRLASPASLSEQSNSWNCSTTTSGGM